MEDTPTSALVKVEEPEWSLSLAHLSYDRTGQTSSTGMTLGPIGSSHSMKQAVATVEDTPTSAALIKFEEPDWPPGFADSQRNHVGHFSSTGMTLGPIGSSHSMKQAVATAEDTPTSAALAKVEEPDWPLSLAHSSYDCSGRTSSTGVLTPGSEGLPRSMNQAAATRDHTPTSTALVKAEDPDWSLDSAHSSYDWTGQLPSTRAMLDPAGLSRSRRKPMLYQPYPVRADRTDVAFGANGATANSAVKREIVHASPAPLVTPARPAPPETHRPVVGSHIYDAVVHFFWMTEVIGDIVREKARVLQTTTWMHAMDLICDRAGETRMRKAIRPGQDQCLMTRCHCPRHIARCRVLALDWLAKGTRTRTKKAVSPDEVEDYLIISQLCKWYLYRSEFSTLVEESARRSAFCERVDLRLPVAFPDIGTAHVRFALSQYFAPTRQPEYMLVQETDLPKIVPKQEMESQAQELDAVSSCGTLLSFTSSGGQSPAAPVISVKVDLDDDEEKELVIR
ncbi:unnamed protein product [Peniophora sp. CBMAI 1063]|nr:unnamed protein product [Peniophora sp. CBMAI 1063]